MYGYADRIVKALDAFLIDRFLSLASVRTGTLEFDRLNVMEAVNAVFAEFERYFRTLLLRLAKKAYKDRLRFAALRDLDEQWVDALLSDYNPVSKYVAVSELDRKRGRLIEAIIASDTPEKEINAALRQLSLMGRMYAIYTVDEAARQADLDENVESVVWVSEDDSRVCSVCKKRDGEVYGIEEVPPKPHIGCRCWLERVR